MTNNELTEEELEELFGKKRMRQAEKEERLAKKMKVLEKRKAEVTKISEEKEKLRGLRKEIKEKRRTYGVGRAVTTTQKTATKFGEGVVVGVKKGAAAFKREAPAAGKTISALMGPPRKDKRPRMPSLFGDESFSFKQPGSYFGDKGIFGMDSKEKGRKETPSYFGSGGLFGQREMPKPTITKARRRKKVKRKKRR